MSTEYKQVFKYDVGHTYDNSTLRWVQTIGEEKIPVMKPDQYINVDGILCWEDNDQPVVSALHKDSRQLEFDF